VLEELKNISPPLQEIGDDDVILREEVAWAIKKKSTGTNGILTELIKVGGDKLAEPL